jgi:hypothetical protein
MARLFNPEKMDFTGEAVSLVESVQSDPQFSDGFFSVSGKGELIYLQGRGLVSHSLVLFDRNGKQRVTFVGREQRRCRTSAGSERRKCRFGHDLSEWPMDCLSLGRVGPERNLHILFSEANRKTAGVERWWCDATLEA